MFSTIQLGLMPLCFGLLFFLMLLYWFQAAFFSYTKYKKLSDSIFYLSLFCLTSLLVLRWVESGHFPLSNLYESLLFLSWSCLLGQLGLKLSRNQNMLQEKYLIKESLEKDESEDIDLLGVVLSPLALISYAFAFLYLPKEMQKATSLVPALQSNWLMMHVTIMILSYAALLCGSVLSMAFLFLNFLAQKKSLTGPLNVETQAEHKNVTETRKACLRSPQVNAQSAFANTLTSAMLACLRVSVLVSQTSVSPSSFPFNMDFCKRAFTNFRFPLTRQKHEKSPMYASAAEERSHVLTDHNALNTLTRKACLRSPTVITVGERLAARTGFSSTNQNAELINSNPQMDILYSQITLCEKLDNLSYRMLGLGFPLLTVGILSGAVWANSAWGSYWSWDPKETWALITWLVFAIYLHARITKGWSGQKAAIIATVGFFVVWFCYLGVNLLGTGLHSYGWFNK